MLRKIFSLLTALTVVLSLFTAVTGTAAALPAGATLLFEDVYNMGFDFGANGYGSVPGKTSLTANGLRIEATSGYAYIGKTLTAPISSGRVVYEIDFMFENIVKDGISGNSSQNYNFPKFCTTSGATVFNSNLTADGSRLAGIDVLNNQRYKYVVDVNLATQKYFKYLYEIDGNGIEECAAGVFNGVFEGSFSPDKDFAKIELVIGGTANSVPQVMYLYKTRAYTAEPEADFLHYEPYMYKNGANAYRQYNDDGFNNINRPVVQNGRLVLSSANGGGYIRSCFWDAKKIQAVDGLTTETEFTLSDIDNEGFFPRINLLTGLVASPYGDNAPFRVSIESSVENDVNVTKLIFRDRVDGDSNIQIGSDLVKDIPYRIKSVMNFTNQSQVVTLDNAVTGEVYHKSNFKLSHTHALGSYFEYLITFLNPVGSQDYNASVNSTVEIDSEKIYVTPIDNSYISFDEFNVRDGFVPTQEHDGIRNAGLNIVVDGGRLKVTTVENGMKDFAKVLPYTISEGKIVVETEFEIENNPVQLVSYGFPGLANTVDGWEFLYQPNITNNNTFKGVTLLPGNKYKQVVISDLTAAKSSVYIYDLDNAGLLVGSELNVTNNDKSAGDGNVVKAIKYLIESTLKVEPENDQNPAKVPQVIYFDNIKVTKAPDTLDVVSFTDASGNAVANNTIDLSVNSEFNITFNTAVDEATLSNIIVSGGAVKVLSLSEDKKTVTLSFDGGLLGGTEYTVTIPNTVLDIYGTGCTAYSKTFTTAVAKDNCVFFGALQYYASNGTTRMTQAEAFASGIFSIRIPNFENSYSEAISGIAIVVIKRADILVGVDVIDFTDLASGDSIESVNSKLFTITGSLDNLSADVYVWDGVNYSPYKSVD